MMTTMNERLFQGKPKTDETHRALGLVEGRWYFWNPTYTEALGGYIRLDQAEMHMRQLDLAAKQCPTGACDD